MNYQLLHQISFFLLYGCLVLGFGIAVERIIFYFYTLRHARRIEVLTANGSRSLAELSQQVGEQDNVPAAAVRALAKERGKTENAGQMENLSQAVYLDMRTRLNRHLWVLDTIVTAAPLLGLLGTILGIIETFTTLASSGISDPKGVSAGIGTALFATALGISTALIVLVFLNHFNDRVDRISDHLKILILRCSTFDV
jgi:biopolymer transport protein ExbB